MAFTHGVYTSERSTALTAPITATAGLQVVFGTAPIHLVEDTKDVLKPQIVYTFEEAEKKLGFSEDFKNFTICMSMKACFDLYAVAPVVFVNVLDPASAT